MSEDLFDRVELKMWELRRSIERARYIQIVTAELHAIIRQRLDEWAKSRERRGIRQGRPGPPEPS